MPPKKFEAALPKFGAQNKIFVHFFATFALDAAYFRNETSHRQTKMLMSIYNMSPKTWLTCRNLWPRHGWDTFRHYDSPFGGHYVATVKVAKITVFAFYVTCNRLFSNIRPVRSFHCVADLYVQQQKAYDSRDIAQLVSGGYLRPSHAREHIVYHSDVGGHPKGRRSAQPNHCHRYVAPLASK